MQLKPFIYHWLCNSSSSPTFKAANYIFLIIAVKRNYSTSQEPLLLLLKLKTGPVENNYHNNDLGHIFDLVTNSIKSAQNDLSHVK